MKINIPDIGTKLQLIEDWTFSLFPEYRNSDIINALIKTNNFNENNIVKTMEDIFCWGPGPNNTDSKILEIYDKYFLTKRIWEIGVGVKQTPPVGGPYCYNMTWSKNTILIVDRVYIRKRLSEYSSITFRAHNIQFPGLEKRKLKFWAKLYDVNNIICEIV